MLAVLLQLVGLVLLTCGIWVAFGDGAGLIAAGLSAVLVGALLERERATERET